jgi:hydrogenase maturation protein HypF
VVRTAVRVEGVVQGVGFRPFVYALATRLGLSGLVGNDVDGVFAEVEGAPAAIAEFLSALEKEAPPLARVERVTAVGLAPAGTAAPFTIVASDPTGRRRTLIAADTATCGDCLRELDDPADRRFGYPFINCTNCGPRFTIVTDVPYDRPLTTMAGFAMCAQCAAEYHDPANRRFHAQPTCCPACGPRLTLLDRAGKPLGPITSTGTGQPGDDLPGGATLPGAAGGAAPRETTQSYSQLEVAAAMLRQGQILAVKGLGGYHLAADAANEQAVASLRRRKHREDKPFAIMASSVAAASQLCEVAQAAATLLESPARPIVLLPRHPDAAVAAAVAPGNRQLGIMLPYTPLHHVLLAAVGRPLVLTSGNVSDEPIAYRDADAVDRLAGIADAFLAHDRAIHIRTDDSVARTVRDRPMLLRRSRGYVPEPVRVSGGFPRPVLACGAELKNTFCLGRENRAFISPHIGDLENAETLRSFTEGIEHFTRLFDITPEVVAYDLHPEYLSTKYALDLDDVELVGVQHHHAHIASCLADNGLAGDDTGGPVIGVAFDGTGYGLDGTIWGGEFLIATTSDFRRAGHLAPVPMPGGAAAIRQPWRMAAAYLAQLAPAGAPGPGRGGDGGSAPRLDAGGSVPGPDAGGSGPGVDAAGSVPRLNSGGSVAGPDAGGSVSRLDAGDAVRDLDVGGSGPGVDAAGSVPRLNSGGSVAGPDAGGSALGLDAGGSLPRLNADHSAAGLDIAGLGVAQRNAARWDPIVAMSRRGFNAPLTSSAGRLFDAAAAILGVRDEITYEGQAAIELEQLADPAEPGAYQAVIIPGAPFQVRGMDLIVAVVEDLAAGVPRDAIAARFHNGIAALIVDACLLIREQEALNTVALSGGVFQNLLLLGKTVDGLESNGFTVLTHSRVPCNDGGISLGQAVIAAARDQRSLRS